MGHGAGVGNKPFFLYFDENFNTIIVEPYIRPRYQSEY
jgi:hypothetical protein